MTLTTQTRPDALSPTRRAGGPSYHLGPASSPIEIRRASGADDIDAARRLHAERYVAHGFVQPTDLVGGYIGEHIDPWASRSEYFLAVGCSGAAVGVSRQIHAESADRLPTLALADLDPATVAELTRQEPGAVVEISALAVAPGLPREVSLLLYAAMWHRSLDLGHAAWVVTVDRTFLAHLARTLGPVLRAFGPPRWYFGGNVVPAVLWTQHVPSVIGRHARGTGNLTREEVVSLFPPGLTEPVRGR